MDWLDLARYADTYGYQADVDRDMSPYRDWVIRAFNDNLPYDQFLTWQLAGDLLPARYARSARRHGLQPASSPDQRRRQHRGRVPRGIRRRSRQHVRHGDARPDGRVCQVSRPQVRSDHAARVLLALRLLQQHRRVRTVFALHERDAHARAAAVAGRQNRTARSDCGTHRRNRTPPEGTGAVRTRAVREMDRERAAVAHPCACCTPRIRRCQCRHERCGQRKERGPDDTGSRGRSTGTTARRSAARPGARAEREWRAAIQRRQQRRAPGCADVRAHGSFFTVDPADAYRGAAARGRPAPVASLDRRRQPRLRADARRRPAVLRADSFLARERDRGSRYTRAPAERVVAAHRDLRRIEPRRGHPAVSRWRTARYRRRARSPGEGHHVPAGGRRSNRRTRIR